MGSYLRNFMMKLFDSYMNVNRLIKIASFFLSLSLSIASHAFKIDTHVAIGLEIIDDIDRNTGKLNIRGVGEYSIGEKEMRSILNHRGAFLAGTVGPDFYPDLIVGQSVVHPGVKGGWKTKDFIKKLLDSAKTDKEYAFALGYMIHAASDVFAHSYINMYSGDEFDLFDGEMDVELRHVVLEGYLSRVVLNAKQKARIKNEYKRSSIPDTFIKRVFFDNKTVLKQYKTNSTAHIRFIKNHKDAIRGLRKTLERFRKPIDDVLDTTLSAIEDVNKFQQDVTETVVVKPVCFTTTTYEEACEWVSKRVCKSVPYPLNELCNWVDKRVCHDIPKTTCEATEETIEIANKLTDLLTDKRNIKKLIEKLDILNMYLRDIENAIDDASLALINTSHESAKHVLLGSESLIFDEYKEWLACHGPVLGGVPSDIVENVNCNAYKLSKKLDEVLDELEDIAGPLVSLVGAPLEAIEKEIKNALKKESLKIAESVLGLKIDDLFDIIAHPTHAHALDRLFEENVSSKGLLNIDNMSQKVAFEISGEYENTLYNFNPTFNAIQLSKISLLSSSEREKLASDAGFNSRAYRVNPMMQVDNIDADHQWLKTPLPLPRDHVTRVEYRKENRFPGMRLYIGNKGLFNTLFRGPLNEGMHMHGDKVLPSWYKYSACKASPFPRRYKDGTCNAILMIPVMFMHH